jgi:limonene-1,2-epoxide hydrolase
MSGTNSTSVENSPSVQIYKAYAEALNASDLNLTRTYLHDDLIYQGPAGNAHGAEAYLKQVGAIGLHQEVHKIFINGEDICVLADLTIAKSDIKIFGCGWFQIKEGKIVSIHTIFDPRPLGHLVQNAHAQEGA